MSPCERTETACSEMYGKLKEKVYETGRNRSLRTHKLTSISVHKALNLSSHNNIKEVLRRDPQGNTI